MSKAIGQVGGIENYSIAFLQQVLNLLMAVGKYSGMLTRIVFGLGHQRLAHPVAAYDQDRTPLGQLIGEVGFAGAGQSAQDNQVTLLGDLLRISI